MYNKRFVAYIDILGFKNIVNDSVINNKTLKNVETAINTIYEKRTECYKGTLGKLPSKEVSVFSDNIVISYEASYQSSLAYLIIECCFIQTDLIFKGFLCCGGIVYGDLYHDDKKVFGPALNKAVEIENNMSIYPRIALDNTIFDDAKEHLAACSNIYYSEEKEIKKLLIKDRKDDCWFVDYLSDCSTCDIYDNYYEYFTIVRKIIINGLKSNDRNIRNKYLWLKNYFNNTIKTIKFIPAIEDL